MEILIYTLQQTTKSFRTKHVYPQYTMCAVRQYPATHEPTNNPCTYSLKQEKVTLLLLLDTAPIFQILWFHGQQNILEMFSGFQED